MKTRFLRYILNREAAPKRGGPDTVVPALSLKPGDTVADLGSGGGYFTLRFADIVGPEGAVYPLDVNRRFLEALAKDAAAAGRANVRPVLLRDDLPPPLPEKAFDLVFVRRVFHHLGDPVRVLGGMKKYLKPDGKIAVLERGENGSGHGRIFGHFTPEKEILDALAAAGYRLAGRPEPEPGSSFLIFAQA